jgi:hypothetical protein
MKCAMGDAIPDGDNLFRAAHHPLAFKGAKQRAFALGRFMALRRSEDRPNCIVTSVIWERYAPTLAHVHAYGCRVSANRNRTKSSDRGKDVYCGAYQFKSDDVRSLASTDKFPEIRARP